MTDENSDQKQEQDALPCEEQLSSEEGRADLTETTDKQQGDHAGGDQPAPCAEIDEAGFPPKEIFCVLSRRDKLNQECLDVVKSLGIRPVILNQPDEARSVMEILNESSKVCFALILLAGDDFVYDRLTGKPGEASLAAKPDAVFFLGYLLARFGNMGTLALYREQKSFRLPVGAQHAAFVPYKQGGGWRQILESKLKVRRIL